LTNLSGAAGASVFLATHFSPFLPAIRSIPSKMPTGYRKIIERANYIIPDIRNVKWKKKKKKKTAGHSAREYRINSGITIFLDCSINFRTCYHESFLL